MPTQLPVHDLPLKTFLLSPRIKELAGGLQGHAQGPSSSQVTPLSPSQSWHHQGTLSPANKHKLGLESNTPLKKKPKNKTQTPNISSFPASCLCRTLMKRHLISPHTCLVRGNQYENQFIH